MSVLQMLRRPAIGICVRCQRICKHAQYLTRSSAAQQVAALSWPEFCRLWKDYIEAMSSALVDASTSAADSAAAQWLARLVYETGESLTRCRGGLSGIDTHGSGFDKTERRRRVTVRYTQRQRVLHGTHMSRYKADIWFGMFARSLDQCSRHLRPPLASPHRVYLHLCCACSHVIYRPTMLAVHMILCLDAHALIFNAINDPGCLVLLQAYSGGVWQQQRPISTTSCSASYQTQSRARRCQDRRKYGLAAYRSGIPSVNVLLPSKS